MQWDYTRKFLKYFVEDKSTFFKYFGLSFIVGVFELFGVALTYPFINKLVNTNTLNKESVLLAVLIVGAFLAKNVFMIFYSKLQSTFTKNCEAIINRRFMNYFIYGKYSTVSKIEFSKKLQVLGFLTPSVINNYLVRLLNLVVNIFIFILITIFLFTKFFLATIITLACALLLLTSQAIFFKRKTSKMAKEINAKNQEMNKSINEPLLNIKSIKILGGENYFIGRFINKQENYKQLAQNLSFYNSIPPYVTEPFIIILLLVLLSIISIQNMSQTPILIASYAVIVSAIFRLAPTISRIQVNLTRLNTSRPQLIELIDFYEKYGINKFEPQESSVLGFNSTIELEDVSFSYDSKKVLDGLDFKIDKGEFIGIVGDSGAGKTTLIDILAGLLQIKTGRIIVDGKLILGTEVPRFRIGYIPQDYAVISGSIRENVAFGDVEIDDEKVVETLKKAQLYDFIVENFKEGIYAEPFVDSIGFSQGQKQRLAIARALYLDPDIIILDEATSSLDLKTEDEICEALNRLKGEKTIIAIAHRLSTIKNADKICFMKNSKIVAEGNFDELYLSNDDFKRLVDLNQSNSIH